MKLALVFQCLFTEMLFFFKTIILFFWQIVSDRLGYREKKSYRSYAQI